MKNFLAVLCACSSIACFSLIIVGLIIKNENGMIFSQLFALFFIINAVALFGYLKTINKTK